MAHVVPWAFLGAHIVPMQYVLPTHCVLVVQVRLQPAAVHTLGAHTSGVAASQMPAPSQVRAGT